MIKELKTLTLLCITTLFLGLTACGADEDITQNSTVTAESGSSSDTATPTPAPHRGSHSGTYRGTYLRAHSGTNYQIAKRNFPQC